MIINNKITTMNLKVTALPTVIGFVDGKPVLKFLGAQNKDNVEKFFDKVLSMKS